MFDLTGRGEKMNATLTTIEIAGYPGIHAASTGGHGPKVLFVHGAWGHAEQFAEMFVFCDQFGFSPQDLWLFQAEVRLVVVLSSSRGCVGAHESRKKPVA